MFKMCLAVSSGNDSQKPGSSSFSMGSGFLFCLVANFWTTFFLDSLFSLSIFANTHYIKQPDRNLFFPEKAHIIIYGYLPSGILPTATAFCQKVFSVFRSAWDAVALDFAFSHFPRFLLASKKCFQFSQGNLPIKQNQQAC